MKLLINIAVKVEKEIEKANDRLLFGKNDFSVRLFFCFRYVKDEGKERNKFMSRLLFLLNTHGKSDIFM